MCFTHIQKIGSLMTCILFLLKDAGALPILNAIKKLRTANYIEDCNVYLKIL